jgi:hypothetical protein
MPVSLGPHVKVNAAVSPITTGSGVTEPSDALAGCPTAIPAVTSRPPATMTPRARAAPAWTLDDFEGTCDS